MSDLLYKFPRPLYRAKITARPSASNKSPYLVDVVLDDDPTQEPQIAHNPALLCGGRLDKGAIIYVMAAPEASKGLSKYQVMLLEAEGTLIITNTQYGNHIAAEIIKEGYLGWIPDSLKAEVTHDSGAGISKGATVSCTVTHGESRFDFYAEADKQGTFVEVKSVPLLDAAGKAALFPVGNRKHKADDPVSPRAVKHAEHLTALAISKTHNTELLFVAMRPDPTHFQISTADITYNNAIRKAHEAGVALCAFSVRPTPEGEVYFEKALDVHI
jgi:DNA-binding sugar fermentation-stimulating protein